MDRIIEVIVLALEKGNFLTGRIMAPRQYRMCYGPG